MNIVLTMNSIYITGKPAEIVRTLVGLSKKYRTLGDLLSSSGCEPWLGPSWLHPADGAPCKRFGESGP